MRIGLMIEGQNGLNWERWRRVLEVAERYEFDAVFRSDHFTNPQPPDKDSLELWASLTYAAATTERIQFGPLVTPVTFRLPAITIKSAAAVHNLSGGRLVLGIGAGWQEREHRDWGIPFPDVPTRFGMLREYLTVSRQALRDRETITFDGTFYQFQDATVLPAPNNGGPPILVGGNGERRTLPLAAEFGDEWNGVFLTPSEFRRLSGRLDVLIDGRGRDRAAVRRSVMLGTVPARDSAQLDRVLTERGTSSEEVRSQGLVVGTPDMWVDRLGEYAAAGADRVMLQWLDLDDIEGIETVGREVLPAFR